MHARDRKLVVRARVVFASAAALLAGTFGMVHAFAPAGAAVPPSQTHSGRGGPVEHGRRCTVWGGRGNDRLVGHAGAVVCGLGGNDKLVALGRHVTLIGGPGNDTLIGSAQGHDVLLGDSGSDTIEAQDGSDDAIDSGTGEDTVRGCGTGTQVSGSDSQGDNEDGNCQGDDTEGDASGGTGATGGTGGTGVVVGSGDDSQ